MYCYLHVYARNEAETEAWGTRDWAGGAAASVLCLNPALFPCKAKEPLGLLAEREGFLPRDASCFCVGEWSRGGAICPFSVYQIFNIELRVEKREDILK